MKKVIAKAISQKLDISLPYVGCVAGRGGPRHRMRGSIKTQTALKQKAQNNVKPKSQPWLN